MTDWQKKWNERYSAAEYAFGEEPNEYFKAQIQPLTAGKALFAAEGEGRNAVFAATLGWDVSAFDISSEGKKKAMRLADKKGVSIDYHIGSLNNQTFAPTSFDLIVLVYAHFPATQKSVFHQQLSELLRPGGMVIFEAFGKNHLSYREKNEKVGGPRDLDSLFSTAELRHDFSDFEIIELLETEVALKEGIYHDGLGSVVRFVGKKR